ncbi:MAG TPA: cytidylate kinase-like family protein [Spirochaetota bacterium]|nr:cytidylate kinase-like family protein [Spirochaetota bacterium]HOD13958.1 cytidylate kinase-like family protein [Spirochaetota bacterium]HPG49736.1 cytidylate kinase-like family protein [Spirochaetota bacterium]HPN11921.1 cytidylate kinase-like family protein [Spirochaetota bacterium]HQL81252.1 cytidylate kinase-like family protein [Spirochaetota bacterium]
MPTSTLDKYISAQVKYWQQKKNTVTAPEERKSLRQFITISREYGCSGYTIGKKIAETLNTADPAPNPLWAAYERQVLDKVMEEMELSSHLVKTLTDDALRDLTDILKSVFSSLPPQVAVYQKLAQTIRILAAHGNVVLVGRASNVITREMSGGYHVMIVAPMEVKVQNVMKNKNLTKKEAEKLVIENTARRENYITEYVRFDVRDPHNYDLIINLGNTNIDAAARLIIEGMKLKSAK